MNNSIYTSPLRLLFAIVTMTVINMVILYLIPIYWVGIVTILLLDIFLWRLAYKKYDLYAAGVSFFGALGGFIWVVYWDVITLIDLFAHRFTIPGIGESLFMMFVGICTAGLFFLGLHYVDSYMKSKDK